MFVGGSVKLFGNTGEVFEVGIVKVGDAGVCHEDFGVGGDGSRWEGLECKNIIP